MSQHCLPCFDWNFDMELELRRSLSPIPSPPAPSPEQNHLVANCYVNKSTQRQLRTKKISNYPDKEI